MKISIIVAAAENGVIGKGNELPWRLSEDLKHFKKTTLGKPVVMGRKTYESVGRPLPGRRNIIITRDTAYSAEGCEVAHSLAEAIAKAGDVEEVMILGGGQIYGEALPVVNRMYLTRVNARPEGDAFFPHLNESEWKEVNRREHPADEKNDHACTFLTLDRIDPDSV